MAAAFINQVPASSYGFDFRYIHGWAFLYRTTASPLLAFGVVGAALFKLKIFYKTFFIYSWYDDF